MRELLARLLAKCQRRDQVSWLVKQGLIVGRNFVMLEDVVIDPSHMWLVLIGNDVTLAHGCRSWHTTQVPSDILAGRELKKWQSGTGFSWAHRP
jgi:hypothetical protein